MKPLHILALVLAGAVGGAVLMKVIQHPRPAAAVAITPVSAPIPQPVSATAAPPPLPEDPPAVQESPAAPEPPALKVAKKEPPRVESPAAPRRSLIKKPSPMPLPPPANPRPLVVAKVQPPAALPAPAQSQAPAAVPTQTAQENPTPEAPPVVPQPENATPPALDQPEVHSVTLNAGMLIPVRLLDGLSTERNREGDPFIATLDHELVADGWVIAERGARVEGRVVTLDKGTKTQGGATLTVELTRLHTSDRQIVAIETDPFEKHVAADHRTDAEKVGAGAAIGAIIGAIAGGGKGAAIGAGVGGGAGAGDVLLTRQAASLPSETRITFRLRKSVAMTEQH